MGGQILVVEDNYIAGFVAKSIINQSGYEVDIAETGEQALTLSLTKKYALILMDLGLGDTDGYEVTKKIREQSDKNQHTPIVALTAHGDEQHKIKCLEIGMNDFLTKPFTMEKMTYISSNFLSYENSSQGC